MTDSITSASIFTLKKDGSWLIVMDGERYETSKPWKGLWTIARILEAGGLAVPATELMYGAQPPSDCAGELLQEFVDHKNHGLKGSELTDGGTSDAILKRITRALDAMKEEHSSLAEHFGATVVETEKGWKYIGDRQWEQQIQISDETDIPGPTLRRESTDFWIISCNGRELRMRHCLGLRYMDFLVRNADRPVPSARLRQEGTMAKSAAVTEDEVFEMVLQEQFSGLVAQAQMLMQEFCPAGDAEDDFQGMTVDDINSQLAQIEKQAKRMAIEARVKKDEKKFQHYVKALKRLDVVRKRLGELQKLRSDFHASNRMARSGVAHAIKLAIQKIGDEDPEIGQFFADRIRTGDDCVFTIYPASELKNAPCEAH